MNGQAGAITAYMCTTMTIEDQTQVKIAASLAMKETLANG